MRSAPARPARAARLRPRTRRWSRHAARGSIAAPDDQPEEAGCRARADSSWQKALPAHRPNRPVNDIGVDHAAARHRVAGEQEADDHDRHRDDLRRALERLLKSTRPITSATDQKAQAESHASRPRQRAACARSIRSARSGIEALARPRCAATAAQSRRPRPPGRILSGVTSPCSAPATCGRASRLPRARA